jgi:hypothetical protein
VAYLGHVISPNGVAMDSDKVAAVDSWPMPRTLRALRRFLGLTGYYRKFIANYGNIARPLTTLLKREAFRWSPEAETAFQCLKQALITAPVLQLSDFSKQFVIECDASGSGFGAVLHQGDGPIAFFSRPVAAHHERELIGLVKGVRGVCRGESRAACLLERRVYGGSELALLMSPVGELGARATEGSSPVGNLLPPIIIQ